METRKEITEIEMRTFKKMIFYCDECLGRMKKAIYYGDTYCLNKKCKKYGKIFKEAYIRRHYIREVKEIKKEVKKPIRKTIKKKRTTKKAVKRKRQTKPKIRVKAKVNIKTIKNIELKPYHYSIRIDKTQASVIGIQYCPICDKELIKKISSELYYCPNTRLTIKDAKKKVIKPKFKDLRPDLYEPVEIKKLRDLLIQKYGNYCMKCGIEGKSVLEHIKSRAYGGTNNLSNLQLLCYKCNFEKGHKEIDYRPF